jgi:hypothetical protein
MTSPDRPNASQNGNPSLDRPAARSGESAVFGLTAAAVVAYGISCVVLMRGCLPAPTQRDDLSIRYVTRLAGPDAVCYGCSLVCLGLMLYVYAFWRTHPRLSRYYTAAWSVLLVAASLASIGFMYFYAIRVEFD